MLNKAMIIGRLGRDPELRYTQTGVPVTTLNVATSETYTDKEGNRNESTEWHRVSVFQRQAENCVRYLRKGSLVFVEGSLQTRKWQDQQGQDRFTTVIRAQRVTFLDRKNEPREDEEGYSSSHYSYQSKDQLPFSDGSHNHTSAGPTHSPSSRSFSPRDEGPSFPSDVDDFSQGPADSQY